MYELSKEFSYKVNSDKEYKDFLKFIESKGFPVDSGLLYYHPTWCHVAWKDDVFKLVCTSKITSQIIDCKEVIGFGKPTELSMKEIQEECKRRFPIGCTFINTEGEEHVLADDEYVYQICSDVIWANRGLGLLYDGNKYATLIKTSEVVKTKFEVGKWYKVETGYKKFSHITKERFYFSEDIYEGTFENYFEPAFCTLGRYEYELLTNLSEIQQYLPDNHPDKFVNKSDIKVTNKQTINVQVYPETKINIPLNKDTKKSKIIQITI